MTRFDWDLDTARANVRKHGVAFEEAETALHHPLAVTTPDRLIGGDVRFRTTGYSSEGRLLVVITSEGGPLPRLISARRATKRERHAHERG